MSNLSHAFPNLYGRVGDGINGENQNLTHQNLQEFNKSQESQVLKPSKMNASIWKTISPSTASRQDSCLHSNPSITPSLLSPSLPFSPQEPTEESSPFQLQPPNCQNLPPYTTLSLSTQPPLPCTTLCLQLPPSTLHLADTHTGSLTNIDTSLPNYQPFLFSEMSHSHNSSTIHYPHNVLSSTKHQPIHPTPHPHQAHQVHQVQQTHLHKAVEVEETKSVCIGYSEMALIMDRDRNSSEEIVYVDEESRSVSTNATGSLSPLLGATPHDPEFNYPELQYKRPKRQFKSKEDRLTFVKTYQSKLKTELCKNWEAYGKCKFMEKCSFAHGAHEIRKKIHLPSNYKTKHCKQFQVTKFCPYGSRCQFFHCHRTQGKRVGISYAELVKTNGNFVEYMISHNDKFEENICYINHTPRARLEHFSILYKNSGKQPSEEN